MRRGIQLFVLPAIAAVLLFYLPSPAALGQESAPDADQAITTMIEAIKEENAPIRNRMFFRLRDIGEPAVDPLIAAYGANSEAPVREYIIKTLGWLGGETAYGFVLEKLKDEQDNIRQKAAEALGTLDDKRAIPALIAALDDPAPNVRIASIVTLGVMEDKQAIEPLKKKLSDPDTRVAKFAENYLELLAITYPEAEVKKGGGQ